MPWGLRVWRVSGFELTGRGTNFKFQKEYSNLILLSYPFGAFLWWHILRQRGCRCHCLRSHLRRLGILRACCVVLMATSVKLGASVASTRGRVPRARMAREYDASRSTEACVTVCAQCYCLVALCMVACTIIAVVLATTSLDFMDFDNGINRVSGNVLSSPMNSYVNCTAYPASCSDTAVYQTYFREWYVGPLATTNVWTTVGMSNVVVDIVEAAYLIAELPSWDAAASASELNVCVECVDSLALVFLLRAIGGLIMCIMGAWIRNTTVDAVPWLVRGISKVQAWCTSVGILVWLCASAKIQSDLLHSFCLRFAGVRYAVGIVFSFVPGVIAVPLTLQSDADAETCSLGDAEDVSVFLTLPLVVAYVFTVIGSLVACACCAEVCSGEHLFAGGFWVFWQCCRLHDWCSRMCAPRSPDARANAERGVV